MRRFTLLLGFWTFLTSSAIATLDDAIARAFQAMNPYAKQGYVVRTDDEWGGDLGVNERKAISLDLLKGNDYRFCMATDVDEARVAVHVYDQRGKRVESEVHQGHFATARVVILVTGTYFIVVEVISSPAERTHWAMVYGAKRVGLPGAISGR
jgi:hypothetical protein